MASDEKVEDALARATQIVETVFKEVHDEFRAWKQDYASWALLAVARPPYAIDRVSIPGNPAPSSSASEKTPPPSSPVDTPRSSAGAAEYIEIWDADTGTTKRVEMRVISVQDVFPAPPAHEYCTPATRNIFQGDDSNDLPFIPFADDPNFDHARYFKEFKTFGWERPVPDPDVEVVVVEAARRLRTEHQMLYKHIDETGVLPLELLDREGSLVVRDFPDWPPGVPASAKHLSPDTQPIPTSPDKLLALTVSTFCSNLNCVVPFCTTHFDPTSMPLKVPSNIKNQRMKEHVRTACGPHCFLLKSADNDDPIHWPDSETEFLRMVLDYSPDARPCELSTICSRPCCEVCYLLAASVQIKSNFGSHIDASRVRSKPCRHEGPCSAATQCACYLNKAHCENGCRCIRKCARRWRGCACSTPKRGGTATICRTERCACFLAHRECDPEICLKCQAKYAYCEANLCKNADIQRARWKKTKVAPGRWGMGLFIAETAVVDDLIIEYVGELIYDPTTDSREPIAEHRGRNYLFELNSTLSIDGTYVGNDARYINHDARNPNCRAKVRMVNGEHRIGIYASACPLLPRLLEIRSMF
ncbi:SET domain-containing protein [Mycena alexandri]|uniref:SET domain-containing protein n=1 Tax=Mycena alexandri TaxID=1745969 RepID=A0AAD6SS21_9AGAR|nr:SET domain-containing protein [Mycena alexandri]